MPEKVSADEARIEQFEAAWEQGPPDPASFLPPETAPEYTATLLELVIIDLEFRWKRMSAAAGDDDFLKTVERYADQFPALRQAELVEQLVEEEFTIRRRYGDQPSVDSFIERFPQLSGKLRALDTQHPPGTTPSVRRAPHVSPVIDHYTLLREIGEGGMGSVYLAQQDEPVRRKVAIKVIRVGLNSRDVIARFEAERQALAMMDHPNIARVYDAGTTDDGQPYFAMEYADGVPLTEYCASHKLSVNKRLHLFNDVCAAVQHAHQKGILHRDLKPSNVLVTEEDGRPVAKVIDFGLAKAVDSTELLTEKTLQTQIGQVLGTLKYMSPEQASTAEQDIDTRADVYALGVMLYELLTGETPLDDESLRNRSVLAVLGQIRDHDPVRPSVRLMTGAANSAIVSLERGTSTTALRQILRGDLDWVVMKALEKERDRRYESAGSLADDVRRFLNDEPVIARPPTTSYRLRKFARKNRVLVGAGVVITALLVVGISTASWLAWRATEAEHTATTQKRIAVANAQTAEIRRIEAEALRRKEAEARRLSDIAARRAQDSLALLVDSFQSIDPGSSGSEDVSARDVLAIARRNLNLRTAADAHSRVTLLTTLSTVFRGIGDIPQALETAQQADQIFRRESLTDSGLRCSVDRSLAWAHAYAGQSDRAVSIMQASLANLTSADDADRNHADELNRARAASILGYLEHLAGHTENGIRRLEGAVPRLRQLGLEANSAPLFEAESALAECYSHDERFDEALPLLQAVLDHAEAGFGATHPKTLRSLDSLAVCHRGLGNFEQAVALHEDCVRRCRVVFSETNRVTLILRHNLGITYEAAGRRYDAIQTLHAVGQEYKDQMQSAAAVSVLERVIGLLKDQLASSEKKSVEPVPDEAAALLNSATDRGIAQMLWLDQTRLGICYASLNQWERAVAPVQAAIERMSGALGDRSPETQSNRMLLATILTAAGRPDDAATVLNDHIRFTHGDTDFSVVRPAYQQRIALALQTGNHALAASRLEEYRRAHPPDFADALGNETALVLQAGTQAAAGQFTEALASVAAARRTDFAGITPIGQLRCDSIAALCTAETTGTADPAAQAVAAFEALFANQNRMQHIDRWCVRAACDRVIRIYEIGGDMDSVQAWKTRRKQLSEPNRPSEA